MQPTVNPKKSESQPFPRARAILEFVEGNLNRPPIIWPVTGGSDEQDEALCREILKRWSEE